MPEGATWKYVVNQSEVATRGSRPAMNKILLDHPAKLGNAAARPGAPAELAALVTRTQPVAKTRSDAHSRWQNDTASYGDATTSLETLLHNLASAPGPEQISKVENWDSRLRAAVPRGSGIYRTLLPGGRAPFSEGGRDAVIQAVKTLGERLAGYPDRPELVALAAEVTTYWNQLRAARETQLGHEGTTDTASRAIEPARLAAPKTLYGNLGRRMAIHEDNPAAVAGYFDLDTLRQPASPPDPAAAKPSPATTGAGAQG